MLRYQRRKYRHQANNKNSEYCQKNSRYVISFELRLVKQNKHLQSNAADAGRGRITAPEKTTQIDIKNAYIH